MSQAYRNCPQKRIIISKRTLDMKKCIWFFAAAIVLTSCNVSNEKKAEKLIRQELNKVIVNIETYEPIETVVDSAFAPMTSAETWRLLTGFPDQLKLYSQLEDEVSSAKRSMSIYANSHSAHSKEMYNQYKEKYDAASKRLEELEAKLTSLTDRIEELSKEEPYFNGYIVHHQYRYVTKDGEKTIGKHVFLMNKDLTAVEAMLDLEDEKVKALQEIINLFN